MWRIQNSDVLLCQTDGKIEIIRDRTASLNIYLKYREPTEKSSVDLQSRNSFKVQMKLVPTNTWSHIQEGNTDLRGGGKERTGGNQVLQEERHLQRCAAPQRMKEESRTCWGGLGGSAGRRAETMQELRQANLHSSGTSQLVKAPDKPVDC